MNNNGSPDPGGILVATSGTTEGGTPRTRRSTVLLIVLALAVLLALYIGSNVLGVLYGMVAPPLPPALSDLTQISYENAAYGVDSWLYSTPRAACDVAADYARLGVCQLAPLQCGDLREVPNPDITRQVAALCSGEQAFSIFTMQWSARIFSKLDETTEIEMAREVFWIGTGKE